MSLLAISIDAAILAVAIGNASRIALLLGLYSAGRLAPQAGSHARQPRPRAAEAGASAALVRERPAA